MRKKSSKILDTVRSTAKGLHAAGAIDQLTMCQFDQLCLQPVLALRRQKSDASAKRHG